MQTIEQLYAKILSTASDLRTANDELRVLAVQFAAAETAYRKAKATEYLQSSGTIPERNATVDLACSDLKLEHMVTEGLHSAKIEEVRSIRAVLSALQTLTHTETADRELAGRHEDDKSHFDTTAPF